MSKINNNQIQNNNQSEFIDLRGEEIFEKWVELDAYKYILLQDNCKQEFARDQFVAVLELTWEYFEQLNNISMLPLYSQDSISFSACLRILDIIYQYASDKVFVSDIKYNSYEDLDNFPLAKLQIILKSSQLLVQSLCFAISIIFKSKLGSVIGVIYNGTTIDYDIKKGNIEDIMKVVSVSPHSLC